ncbi:MAG: hypothetical protein K2P85_01920 [Flavobacteriaceae bacterium]|nr:hypothetical protein [Flavobacteriaceae bacterium]
MTKEDKIYVGGGLALLVAGVGFWYYKKANANQDNTQQETIDTTYEDVTNTPPVKLPSTATPPIVSVPVEAPMKEPLIITADKFYYQIGQEVMANSVVGTKTYQAKKMADGNYSSNRKTQAIIQYGDKIGKIIWVGKRSDGTYRYVIERDGKFVNTLHWVASVSAIKPIGKILPPKPVLNTTGLVLTRMLHKGIVKSDEVKELQRRLGLVPDGAFGPNTEKALLAKKKVKQIRLADWK